MVDIVKEDHNEHLKVYLSRLSLWDSVEVYKGWMLPGNSVLLGRTERSFIVVSKYNKV